MNKLFILLLLPAFVISSCRWMRPIKGNGTIKTEERTVNVFKSVHCTGSIQLYLQQDSQAPVKIETDENLLPFIEIRQRGNHLTVTTKSDYTLRPSDDINVYITAPEFEKISCSGSGNIHSLSKINTKEKLELTISGSGNIALDVNTPSIDGNISGSGSLQLKGETRDIDLKVSGSGNANCYELKAENAHVRASGSGDAELYASVKVDARASGSGNIRYKGGATEVKKSESGSGSVSKVN
jgi:hypothetical protein